MTKDEASPMALDAALRALCLDSTSATFEPLLRHPEQLAMRFGQAVLAALERSDFDLHPDLLKSLNDLAALLNRMSAQAGRLWTTEAVLNDPSWQQVQQLARQALSELGGQADDHGPLH